MVFIVAEIGVNWHGLAHACRMIIQAKNAGADAVKFQCFTEEHVRGHPRFKELQRMCLDLESLKILKECADYNHIEFFCTPFYPEAVDLLEAINVKRYKIRYADQDNYPLLARVKQTNKSVFVSVQNPWNWMADHGPCFYILYCVPKYPPTLQDFQILSDIAFGMPHTFYGYSNHYPGMAPALLAVARGAEYVEIHVKDYPLPNQPLPIDDAVSWDYDQLEEFIKLVREMEQIL